MRISRAGRAERITLTVEGWIDTEAAGLLEAECNAILGAGQDVLLDLSGVRYLSASAAEILRHLQTTRTEIARCPPLILSLMERGNRP
ncbi:MAG: hypothetical protein DHS20C21_04790 [Gemmatimonadota bacterium]|nr:MAG: hypothetical protein DHS20C21_04790 [Gemmatimonadota bacterium]